MIATQTTISGLKQPKHFYSAPSPYTSTHLLPLTPAPPFFLNTSIRIAVFEGASTTLPCLVAPDDTLSFSWSFQGSPVATSEPDSRAALDSNGGLILENVLESDEGAYTCTAINSLGGAEGIVEFKVYCEFSYE